jgi:L-lactate dehydrogenase complex protein LldE
MKVALFIPCFIDAFYPEVGIATLELLERFGIEVDYPQQQTCCGQPMANSGAHAEAAGAERVTTSSGRRPVAFIMCAST